MAENELRWGAIGRDRYWIERSDGRLFQIDGQAKTALERLAGGIPFASVCGELDVDEEELDGLLDLLGLTREAAFSLRGEAGAGGLPDMTAPRQGLAAEAQADGPTVPPPSAAETDVSPAYICPWLEKRWFLGAVLLLMGASAVLVVMFVRSVPLAMVGGLAGQWLVAGALSAAVALHELGHVLAMPRNSGLKLSVHAAGPLPVVSVVCNAAWKLPARKRVRIDAAGFAVDLIVCGAVAAVGLAADDWAPWIWTFLLVHGFRMIFAIWPLLPGDGYWLLVDLCGVPNLRARANASLRRLEPGWLALYALLRLVFMPLLWLLYAWMLYVWLAVVLLMRPEEALRHLLYPAPVLLALSVSSQLVAGARAVWRRWRPLRETSERSGPEPFAE